VLLLFVIRPLSFTLLLLLHFFFIYLEYSKYLVRLGDVNILSDKAGDEPQDFGVAEAIPHPNYQRRPSFWNDIAILTLDGEVLLSGERRMMTRYPRYVDNYEGVIMFFELECVSHPCMVYGAETVRGFTFAG
jgi:hypothetical protein